MTRMGSVTTLFWAVQHKASALQLPIAIDVLINAIARDRIKMDFSFCFLNSVWICNKIYPFVCFYLCPDAPTVIQPEALRICVQFSLQNYFSVKCLNTNASCIQEIPYSKVWKLNLPSAMEVLHSWPFVCLSVWLLERLCQYYRLELSWMKIRDGSWSNFDPIQFWK